MESQSKKTPTRKKTGKVGSEVQEKEINDILEPYLESTREKAEIVVASEVSKSPSPNHNPSKQDKRKNSKTFTADDVLSAKFEQQSHQIQRNDRISGWNDYIGFAISKTVGTIFLAVGLLEWLLPDFLTVTLEKPDIIAGVGFVLLTGKNIISWISKFEKQGGK